MSLEAGSNSEFNTSTASAVQKSELVGLNAAVILTIFAYSLALAASALVEVRARALDGVPLYIGAGVTLAALSRHLFPRAIRLARGIEAACIIVVLGLSLACLSYIGAIIGFPLRDREMIWLDSRLGFDWLQMMRSIDTSPYLLNLLDWAYQSFTSQLIITVLVLVIAKRTRELDCFLVTFICVSLMAELLSVLIPTLGPMSALAVHTKFVNLPTLGRTTAEILLALRERTLNTIDFDALNGIISFPSLHAAVAILIPYTLRWNKILFPFVFALDGLMLISAVPCGNHYLTDVLGGVAVAVSAIVCGPRLQKKLGRLIPGPRATIPIAAQTDFERSPLVQ
jgi:membrane-associated phospholipid phosphatase